MPRGGRVQRSRAEPPPQPALAQAASSSRAASVTLLS
jgi:hypothetical protein